MDTIQNIFFTLLRLHQIQVNQIGSCFCYKNQKIPRSAMSILLTAVNYYISGMFLAVTDCSINYKQSTAHIGNYSWNILIYRES